MFLKESPDVYDSLALLCYLSNYHKVVSSKKIKGRRSSSCYMALCAKSVGILTHTVASHIIVTERQFSTFTILYFYTFKRYPCLEKCC